MSGAKKKQILFNVDLDQDNMPEKITWQATDSGQPEAEECKSMMIALWDGKEQNTMRIDLWTKAMQIDEMHTHFFQMLLSLGDSYQKATGNPFVKDSIKQYCMELADKTRAWEKERGNIQEN